MKPLYYAYVLHLLMNQESSPYSIATTLYQEMEQQQFPESALYIVATPIGNIGDITFRALHVLSMADAIACEDTRNSGQLLRRYGINKPLIAAHEHNEREAAEKIIHRLNQGERIALICDAGTPAVSDPGARIVDTIRNETSFRVIPIPGASATVTALSASGLVNTQFSFIGFLPTKNSQRQTLLKQLNSATSTLIFYEAPHRIIETIQAMLEAFGPERQIVFARELTKLFENIHRMPLGEAVSWLEADPNRQKGEFAILIEGAQVTEEDDAAHDDLLRILLSELPMKQAAQIASAITGQKKNALYDRALLLKNKEDN